MSKFRLVKEAQLRQYAVIAGGGVALAEDEPVPIRVLGIFGIDPHLGTENGAHELHGGQGAAGVAAAGGGGELDDIAAYLGAERFQLCCVHGDTPPFIIYHKYSIPHNSRIVNRRL